jgi:ABC-type branched-subunit amino acid transport system permease subunit
VAIIILLILPFFISDYFVSVLLNILMWIALTESWIILSGYTGYISLGHAAFFGVGAYLMALLWRKLPFFAIVRRNVRSQLPPRFVAAFDVPLTGVVFVRVVLLLLAFDVWEGERLAALPTRRAPAFAMIFQPSCELLRSLLGQVAILHEGHHQPAK